MYVICADDARFFNHSDNPNVSSSPDDDLVDFALRDIRDWRRTYPKLQKF